MFNTQCTPFLRGETGSGSAYGFKLQSNPPASLDLSPCALAAGGKAPHAVTSSTATSNEALTCPWRLESRLNSRTMPSWHTSHFKSQLRGTAHCERVHLPMNKITRFPSGAGLFTGKRCGLTAQPLGRMSPGLCSPQAPSGPVYQEGDPRGCPQGAERAMREVRRVHLPPNKDIKNRYELLSEERSSRIIKDHSPGLGGSKGCSDQALQTEWIRQTSAAETKYATLVDQVRPKSTPGQCNSW